MPKCRDNRKKTEVRRKRERMRLFKEHHKALSENPMHITIFEEQHNHFETQKRLGLYSPLNSVTPA